MLGASSHASFDTRARLQCREVSDGCLSGGIVGAIDYFIAKAEVLVQVGRPRTCLTCSGVCSGRGVLAGVGLAVLVLPSLLHPTPPPPSHCAPATQQPKSDQVAFARSLGVRVDLSSFNYSVAAAFADPAYAELRFLGGICLFPLLNHIVSATKRCSSGYP